MNRLAAAVQFWAEPEIVAIIPRESFGPAPKIDSAIVKLTRTDAEYTRTYTEKYYLAVRSLFAQPRKTILNNLAASDKRQATKTEIIEKLKKIGINPQLRPQNLSIEDIIKIANFLL